MKKILLCGLLLTVNSFANPPTREEISKLLQANHAADLATVATKQMFEGFRRQAKNKKQTAFLNDFEKKLNPKGFIDLVIPIYQDLLTERDVLDLTKFYESDAGRRYVAVQPQLVQRSMAAGRQWGMDLARQVLAEMQEKK